MPVAIIAKNLIAPHFTICCTYFVNGFMALSRISFVMRRRFPGRCQTSFRIGYARLRVRRKFKSPTSDTPNIIVTPGVMPGARNASPFFGEFSMPVWRSREFEQLSPSRRVSSLREQFATYVKASVIRDYFILCEMYENLINVTRSKRVGSY